MFHHVVTEPGHNNAEKIIDAQAFKEAEPLPQRLSSSS